MLLNYLPLICMLPILMGATSKKPFYQMVFQAGTDGYHSYRIPAIVRTNKGTLMAFAEGRVNSRHDYGNIDLVVKRSFDDGKTWSNLDVIVGNGPLDRDLGTWGNPTPVVDRTNGKIWLFLCYNDKDHAQNGGEGYEKIGVGDRKVYVTHSVNDGTTWAVPVDVSSTTQPPTKTFDVVGPGIGIQTSVNHKNRLIIPASSRNIYSDDAGKTWQYKVIPGGTGEGTVVELSNGDLLSNDRPVGSFWAKSKTRWVSVGNIEKGFPPFLPQESLIDPRCQGSTLNYKRIILFMNSASVTARTKMTVKMSEDDGKTWPMERRLYDEFSPEEVRTRRKGGYSSMVGLENGSVGALIENSDKDAIKGNPFY